MRSALTLLLAVAAEAWAEERPLHELPAEQAAALAPLLRASDLALLESSPDGRMKQVTVMAFAGAPPDVVRTIVTTPEKWSEFGRNLSRAHVVRNADGSIDYDFAIDLRLVSFEINHQMWLRDDGAVDVKDRGPHNQCCSDTNYRWRFLPVADGTLIVQYGYTDVRQNPYVRRVVDAAPTMEHGLALATQLFYVRAIKERAEALTPSPTRAPAPTPTKTPSLRFLLERGRVALMRSQPNGRLGDISLVDTVYAPKERIQEIIAAPEHYRTFIDGMKKSTELSRSGGEITYDTSFDLSIFTWDGRFALRRDGDDLDSAGLAGDLRNTRYRWSFTARAAKETQVVLRAVQDLAAASPLLLANLFKREPLFEHGIAVAVGLVHLVGVRGRAEGWK